MADMDLDLDLDGPSKAPARAARFAPKSSKLKPQTLIKPKTETPSTSNELDSAKKEELEHNPPLSETKALEQNDDVPMEAETAAVEEEKVKEEEQMPMETDDIVEDEVVREIDVFFTPSVDPKTQLYVLQYPLRPLWRPYELEERCQEVRLRPSSSEMEVDLAIDFDSKNFDHDTDPAVRMTKTLASSWVPSCTSGYAVGVLTGNKLHLNPIHAVVQLRPSLQHLKVNGSKKKNTATSNDEKTVDSEEVKEEKPVGPLKKQSKPLGNDKDIGEQWIQLKYHGARSDISARYLHKMAMEEGSTVPFSMSPVDYLNVLCPVTSTDSDRYKNLRTSFFHSLPFEERYKNWLLEGPPIHRFDALKHLAPDYPNDEILRVLQKYAQLVQGLWVPKSSLVYGKDDGVEVLARDFVLFEFSKSPFIKRSVFERKPEFLKAAAPALKSLAVERPLLNDWKLKEHPDKKFEKLYGEVVKEQQAAWERLGKKMHDLLSGGKNRPTMRNPVNSNANNISALPSSGKPAPRSSQRTSMSEETRQALPKALQKVLKIHKVCSFQQICQRLREMAVSESTSRPKGDAREAIAAANGVDAPPEELQAVIKQVAVNIHGVYVLKSSPDNPHYDPLRNVVINLFIAEGPSAKLKKAAIFEAAKLQLERDITNVEFQKVMQELCVSKNSAWVLKSGDGNPT